MSINHKIAQALQFTELILHASHVCYLYYLYVAGKMHEW